MPKHAPSLEIIEREGRWKMLLWQFVNLLFDFMCADTIFIRQDVAFCCQDVLRMHADKLFTDSDRSFCRQDVHIRHTDRVFTDSDRSFCCQDVLECMRIRYLLIWIGLFAAKIWFLSVRISILKCTSGVLFPTHLVSCSYWFDGALPVVFWLPSWLFFLRR